MTLINAKTDDLVPTRQRAFCYITANDHIVLLGHVDHPHMALQIPGGTVEAGEAPADAALREAQEETGLKTLKMVGLLGEAKFDMRQHGRADIIHGWFYHFSVDGFEHGTSWRQVEHDAHGGGGPVQLELSWHSLSDLPAIFGNDASFIEKLNPESKT